MSVQRMWSWSVRCVYRRCLLSTFVCTLHDMQFSKSLKSNICRYSDSGAYLVCGLRPCPKRSHLSVVGARIDVHPAEIGVVPAPIFRSLYEHFECECGEYSKMSSHERYYRVPKAPLSRSFQTQNMLEIVTLLAILEQSRKDYCLRY